MQIYLSSNLRLNVGKLSTVHALPTVLYSVIMCIGTIKISKQLIFFSLTKIAFFQSFTILRYKYFAVQHFALLII